MHAHGACDNVFAQEFDLPVRKVVDTLEGQELLYTGQPELHQCKACCACAL